MSLVKIIPETADGKFANENRFEVPKDDTIKVNNVWMVLEVFHHSQLLADFREDRMQRVIWGSLRNLHVRNLECYGDGFAFAVFLEVEILLERTLEDSHRYAMAELIVQRKVAFHLVTEIINWNVKPLNVAEQREIIDARCNSVSACGQLV